MFNIGLNLERGLRIMSALTIALFITTSIILTIFFVWYKPMVLSWFRYWGLT